jgi:hypothetical protein
MLVVCNIRQRVKSVMTHFLNVLSKLHIKKYVADLNLNDTCYLGYIFDRPSRVSCDAHKSRHMKIVSMHGNDDRFQTLFIRQRPLCLYSCSQARSAPHMLHDTLMLTSLHGFESNRSKGILSVQSFNRTPRVCEAAYTGT